jgi:tetratricopeptide (TPR) repeat protein
MVLVNLGELGEARRLIEREREIARQQGDVEVVGQSHMRATYLAYFAGEPEAALANAGQALEIAERVGNPFSRAYAWFALGLAEQMRGELRKAIEAFERALAIAGEGRLAIDGAVLALLGVSYLGLGETERANALVTEGLEIARAQGNAASETLASLALARLLMGSGGPISREKVEAPLARALELARETGGKAFEPPVHVELAELARHSGDEEGHERELREAHRLFVEIGATGHAARLELELASVP